MSGTSVARPAPLTAGVDQAGETVVRRFVTVLAVVVGGLCFLFSLGNVYQLAVDLELWVWIRPLVAPAVDLSLVALVVGIRFLARRGVSDRELRRPRLFMLAVGLAAWALNTAGAVAERDWGKAAFDSLAPGLLIGWAEVLPWFLRQFHAITHPAAAPAPVPVPSVDAGDAAEGTVPMSGPTTPPVPASAAAEAEPGPVPAVRDGARRVPSRPRRTRSSSRPVGTGTGAAPAVPAELVERAIAVARAFQAEHGRPISRDALGRILHVGNRTAGKLLSAVRAAPPPASADRDQTPAARTGTVPASPPAAPPGPAPVPAEAGPVPVPVSSLPAGNGRRPGPGDRAPASSSRNPARVS